MTKNYYPMNTLRITDTHRYNMNTWINFEIEGKGKSSFIWESQLINVEEITELEKSPSVTITTGTDSDKSLMDAKTSRYQFEK